ncbi:tonB-dependent receptor [Brevundimonas abyssalis TAR-001]|uniref:TonB-dependent receptor n=2 Tax=Brevundimonas TaxID=41275 RepID=A0A8E0N885_9CAUL|nr:tonB-dependent receptor [Brevundimonas abyssalis TAR-001]
MMFGACAVAVAAPAYAQDVSYDIPAGDLASSLDTYGRQAGREVLYRVEDVRGARSSGVRGRMSPDAALRALLMGTGFTFDRDGSGAVAIIPIRGTSSTAAADDGSGAPIVVTGSRIRGAPVAAPVISIDQTEMRNAGQTDLGQVIRSIPQNHVGGQNPGIGSGGEQLGTGDFNGTSQINLRGLGPAATLTLLNGRRLSYGGASQGVDISAIPLAAVERIQIVADGSSALYGSDAVAGVANVILKRDLDELVVTARAGGATDGGHRRYQASATLGETWSSGGLMIAGDFDHWSKITAEQRSYTSGMNPSATIYPNSKRWGGLASLHQRVGDAATVGIDGLYSNRTSTITVPYLSEGDFTIAGAQTDRRAESFLVSPNVELDLGGSWTVSLGGSYGEDKALSDATAFDSGTAYYWNTIRYDNDTSVVEAGAEGPVYSLPAGSVRLAIGAGYRSIGLTRSILTNGAETGAGSWSRGSYYGYGEVFFPLVSPGLEISGVDRLSLNLAVRYEDVESAGTVATPKVGLIYAPIPDITLAATWGRSFKAPTLFDQFQGYYTTVRSTAFFGGQNIPEGATALFVGGGNENLKPERSTNRVLALTLEPQFWEGARFEISHFDIDYTDRIAAPLTDLSSALTNFADASFIVWNPSGQEISQYIDGGYLFDNAVPGPFDPSNIVVVVDNRFQNVARQRVNGIDIAAGYGLDIGPNDVIAASVSASAVRLRRQLNPNDPFTTLSGTLFNPPKWRGRAGVTYTGERLTVSTYANYTGPLEDVRPASTIDGLDSQLTFDLTAQFRPGLPLGLEFEVAAINILSAKPQNIYVSHYTATPFDSANYPAIGRFITFAVTSRW